MRSCEQAGEWQQVPMVVKKRHDRWASHVKSKMISLVAGYSRILRLALRYGMVLSLTSISRFCELAFRFHPCLISGSFQQTSQCQ